MSGRFLISVWVSFIPTMAWWFVTLDWLSPWQDGFSRMFWLLSTVYVFAATYWLVGQSRRIKGS